MQLWNLDANGTLTLDLHEAQSKVWQSDRRFTALIAGTQSGKTSYAPWHLWKWVRQFGSGDYLAATASYDLFKLKMLPEMLNTFEHVLRIGRYWAGDKIVELQDPTTGKFWASRADDRMWGRIILRSAQAPGGLESASVLAALLDEAGQDDFTLAAWEAVLRRLSLSQGPVFIGTTPYNLGWIKTEIYDRWRAGHSDYLVVQADSTVNPAFPQAELERARETLPAWKFNMFYRGQFGRPAGMIYGDYDESLHLIDPFPIPLEWPRYVGLDFGANNTAKLWLAEDVARDALYVYRESLEGGKTTQEHVNDALKHATTERVVRWVGGSHSETQQRRDWGAAGIRVHESPIVDVEAGIDRVIQLFKQNRLFIFNTCRGLMDELGRYSRVIDDMGQPTEKIKDKETFHRLDALRYIVGWKLGRRVVTLS